MNRGNMSMVSALQGADEVLIALRRPITWSTSNNIRKAWINGWIDQNNESMGDGSSFSSPSIHRHAMYFAVCLPRISSKYSAFLSAPHSAVTDPVEIHAFSKWS
jgi:hypothetical protein